MAAAPTTVASTGIQPTRPLPAAAPEAAPADPGRPAALLLPEPRRRGVLVINDRAARKVVETILSRQCPEVLEATARVRFVGDEAGTGGGAVDIGASLRLRYPTTPLADTLASVRTRLTDEAHRQLGRPVRTSDLTVEELVVAPPRTGRRVS